MLSIQSPRDRRIVYFQSRNSSQCEHVGKTAISIRHSAIGLRQEREELKNRNGPPATAGGSVLLTPGSLRGYRPPEGLADGVDGMAKVLSSSGTLNFASVMVRVWMFSAVETFMTNGIFTPFTSR